MENTAAAFPGPVPSVDDVQGDVMGPSPAPTASNAFPSPVPAVEGDVMGPAPAPTASNAFPGPVPAVEGDIMGPSPPQPASNAFPGPVPAVTDVLGNIARKVSEYDPAAANVQALEALLSDPNLSASFFAPQPNSSNESASPLVEYTTPSHLDNTTIQQTESQSSVTAEAPGGTLAITAGTQEISRRSCAYFIGIRLRDFEGRNRSFVDHDSPATSDLATLLEHILELDNFLAEDIHFCLQFPGVRVGSSIRPVPVDEDFMDFRNIFREHGFLAEVLESTGRYALREAQESDLTSTVREGFSDLPVFCFYLYEPIATLATQQPEHQATTAWPVIEEYLQQTYGPLKERVELFSRPNNGISILAQRVYACRRVMEVWRDVSSRFHTPNSKQMRNRVCQWFGLTSSTYDAGVTIVNEMEDFLNKYHSEAGLRPEERHIWNIIEALGKPPLSTGDLERARQSEDVGVKLVRRANVKKFAASLKVFVKSSFT